jgi:thiosulfate/3-mercaptopyruvate sulfurtransferase
VIAAGAFLGPRLSLGQGKPDGSQPQLISTDRLAELMVAGEGLTLLDVRVSWVDYVQNHLPSAQWANVETFRAGEAGLPFQLLPWASYRVLWSRLGVRRDRPVVVYSAGISLDKDATFLVWLLAASGQPQVYLLDGGFAKWEAEGRPLTQTLPRFRISEYPKSAFRPETATLEDVQRAVERRDVLMVDARAPAQFQGQAGAQPRRGHIPGAVNHPLDDDLEHRDASLVWKPVENLRAAYGAQGVTADRDIIVYCNTGTEASHLFFALRYLLGYPKVRIYLGSWTEWAERGDLPIETGP